MKKPMSILNQKGFSLVELMVVVGIIAILSTIAIPSYQTFQAKARQKEGFNMLNTFFSTAHATKAEFGFFAGNLVGTGFQPVGNLGYRLRSLDNTGADRDTGDANFPMTAASNDDACQNTSQACNCGGACGTYNVWQDAGGGAVGATIGPLVTVAACGALPAPGTTDTTFSIRIAGVISLKSAQADAYGMDHNKQIVMCQDGLK